MEQQEQQEPRPSTPSTTQRDSRLARASPSPTPTPRATSHSTFVTTTQSVQSRDPLSTSEPTLRFPRPQGSRHLANWISTSNPNIMQITTSDDEGLAGSSYELITGTDSESFDDNYTESIGDSVASLDLARHDDVHSIAGTEHTYDDESLAGDPFIELAHGTSEQHQESTTLEATQTLPEEEEEDEEEEQQSPPKDEPLPEDEENSRSSLEYARQSLSTPSLPTPEASGIVERPTAPENDAKPAPQDEYMEYFMNYLQAFLQDFRNLFARFRRFDRFIWDTALEYLARSIVFLLLGSCIFSFWTYQEPQSCVNPAVPSSTAAPSIIPSSVPSALTTSAVTSALVPVDDGSSDDWIFTRKPDVFFSKLDGDYLLRITPSVKPECLSIAAYRDEAEAIMNISPFNGDFLVSFPYDESYGTLNVKVTSTCRPKVKQIFEVSFPERSIVEEAMEFARNVAHDLSEGVPAAAQEAERRLDEAKKTLGLDSLSLDTVLQGLGSRFAKAHRSLGPVKVEIRDRARETAETVSKQFSDLKALVAEHLPDRNDVQDQAQLHLLAAQLKAKVWWLQVTGSKQYEDYKSKAKKFLALEQDKVSFDRQQRYYLRHFEEESWLQPEVWNRLFREARCRMHKPNGLRGNRECDRAA